MFSKLSDRLKLNIPISLKLSVIYGCMLLAIMLASGAAMTGGLFYMLYNQSGREITASAEQVLTHLQYFDSDDDPEEFTTTYLHPGVILHITDTDGHILFNSAQQTLLLQETNSQIRHELNKKRANFDDLSVEDHLQNLLRLFLERIGVADASLHTLDIDDSTVYYSVHKSVLHGQPVRLYFFKTVNAENDFLDDFIEVFGYACIGAVLAAVMAGFIMSRRMLKPLRDITQSAREISVAGLSRRIEVAPTHDELEQLATTFNSMLDRLEDGFKKQRQFVSDASHELRTPATVVKGYADMLSRWGKDDPEVLEEGLAAIHSEANNMQQLIEKLLFLARADQNRQIVHLQPVELDEIMEETAAEAKIIAPHLNIKLAQCEPLKILADPVLFKQMLRIFIENGSKYTPEGGSLTLACFKDNGTACITIADTGIGIAQEHLDKIFERFYRVDSDRSRESGGTGLGLSIAKWIAGEHHIKIELLSKVGKGTTVKLTAKVI